MRSFVCAVLIVGLSSLVSGQQQNGTNATTTTSTSNIGMGLALDDATPIRLRLSRNVSSADAHTGDTVDFEVLEEVKIGNIVVVPKGGIAWGTVTEAEHKRRMARGGKIDMTIDSVKLVDGEKAALRGVRDASGGGHTGAMTGGIVATALIVWPAAPFFLFMHGKDITIPKGTEITAYVNGTMPLDVNKFHSIPNPASAPAENVQATLEISSTPSGADVEIDGKFVGDTPSSIGVPPGEHKLKIAKTGYVTWERTISTSTGSIHLSPELVANSPSPAN